MDGKNVISQDDELSLNNLSKIRVSGVSPEESTGTGEKYYGITLDGKIVKTMYKENLLIPSRALAVALAEEWEAQLDTIDLRSMHLNTMVGKGVRAINDETL